MNTQNNLHIMKTHPHTTIPITGCTPGRQLPPAWPPRACRAVAARIAGLGLLCACLSARAATDATNVSVNLSVPDGTPDGLASTIMMSTPIQSLTNLLVTLNVTNGWNGDLYAYLVHDPGFVVLLNRVGKSDSLPYGYNDDGFNVTFDDSATNNIHTYRFTLFGSDTTPVGGPLLGSWVPDGRDADPATVSSTNTPDTSLSAFNGLNPNGEWTLFIADLSSGGMSTLVSWGLEMAGTVPFPPVVTVSPATTNLECGNSVVLTANATGGGTLSYQWYDNYMNPLAGQTGTTLSLNNLHPADSGNYTVIVTNNDGAATNFAVVTVTDTIPPTITMLGAALLTNECHSAFVDPGATATDSCSGATLTTNSTVNANAVGVYVITYIATDGSGNSATNTRTVRVVDTTAPVVTLNGANPMTVECHSAFTDPGATANDACAGSLSVTVSGTVNANAPGTYTLTYIATDPSGNSATNTRTVNVVDTTPPVISWSFTNLTLSADANCQALMPDVTGTNYILAADACSSVLTITQTPTNNAVLALGTNVVVLAVADGNGNTAYSTNTVVVADTTPPVITVLGANPITNECHSTFVDPGFTATDNCSGEVSLSTNNLVNVNSPGTYPITYVATDAAGNSATNTRTVYVVDTTPPVITQCAPPQTVTAGYNGLATLADLTALVAASDACSTFVNIVQQPAGGTQIGVGDHTVVFRVDDGNGNTNTCSTSVTVNAAPLVPPTIIGQQTLDDGTFQLTFSGPQGQPYQVLASEDLGLALDSWDSLTNAVFGAVPAVFTDTDATNYPMRFYRVVSP
jgi:subtilisin-like proprotein convertase family protein